VSVLSRVLIIVGFMIAGAAVYLYNGGGAARSALPELATVNVRVAAEPLRVGTFLDSGRAPFQPMSETDVPDDAVTDADDGGLLGAVIIAPVAAGAPVPRSALLAPGQEGFLAAVLRPGFRAVSLPVDEVSGNAGLIFPGDRVDLLLTQMVPDDDGFSGERWASETILRDVRVIAVDQRLNGQLSERAMVDEREVARTVTLEVRPGGAETIAVARNLGAISLTLRSLIVEGDSTAGSDAPNPIWAHDVSAVTRATARDARVEDEATAGPPPAPLVVIRGGVVQEVAQ
jgi:pilus assembly protein CpaB